MESQVTKYLGKNLMQRPSKNRYAENDKTFLKEIEEEARKQVGVLRTERRGTVVPPPVSGCIPAHEASGRQSGAKPDVCVCV